MIGDEPLTVAHLVHKAERKKEIQKKFQKQNLVIHNLPEETTKEDLEQFFGKFGPLINCKIFTKPVGVYSGSGPKTVKCSGVGFVCYQTPITASIVQRKPQEELVIKGNPLSVHFCKPKFDMIFERRRTE